MKEKIQRIWGESFATFATFAMQILKRPDAAALCAVPVKSTVKVAQRFRITRYLPLFATLAMLTFGVGNAWGECYELTRTSLKTDARYDTKSWGITTHHYYYSTPDWQVGTITNPYGKVSQVNITVASDKTNSGTQKFKIIYKCTGDATWMEINTEYSVKSWRNSILESWKAQEQTIILKTSDIAALKDIVAIGVRCTNYASYDGADTDERELTINAFSVSFDSYFNSSANGTTLEAFPLTEVNTTCPTSRSFTFSYNGEVTSYTWTSSNSEEFPISVESYASSCGINKMVTVNFTPISVGDSLSSIITGTDNKGNEITVTVVGSSWGLTAPTYSYNATYWNGVGTQIKNVYVGDVIEYVFRTTSTATPTYSIVKKADDGTNNGDAVTLFSANKLIAGRAGTYELTINQAEIATSETSGYNEGSSTIVVIVQKHTPTFTWNLPTNYYYNTTVSSIVTKTSGGSYSVTSNNEQVASTSGDNVIIYNKPGTANIRVLHPETYYWEEYDHSESITPEWRNDTVSFSLTDANHTIYESANTFSSGYAYWNNDKDGYFLGATSMGEVSTKRENYAIIHFTGIPDTLYFDQKLNKYVVLPKDRVCYVMVSANGSTWNDTVWRQEAEIEYMNNQKVCLPSSTRYIKFYYNGTISSEYKNIRVSKRKYFKTDKASLDFATNVKNASCDAQTFKFHHASAGYITSVTSSDSHFTVSPVSVTTGGEICDSAVITVSYSTAEVGEHSGTITISDNIGNSTSVSVTGTTVDAYTPTITWPGATSYLVGSTIANNFVAKDNNEDIISGTWSFESSDSTVIDVVEGELKAICGGTATITGTIAEGATWSSGSQTVSLTVTRNADSFTWNNVAEDGKIHVWADSDIPSSIVSANTAINGFTSGNSDRLTVSGSKGSFTLHAGHKGEVTLTATSEGDCTYLNGADSKTVVVDPCYHSIIWEQNFQGIQADENGHIDSTIVLNAYAVDSLGNRTSVGITYSIGSGSCAEMKDGKLHLKGVGDATIIATTATDDKYAVVSETKPISVVLWGVNKAMSANDDSDISDGKVVFEAPHARFTFGGETDITTFHYAKVQGKPEGYQLAMYLDKNDGTPKYYFTWESTNANCSIQVTKISFWAKAYTSNATLTNNGQLSFNGEDFVAIGTAALTANDGDFKHFDKPGTYTDSVWITCKSTWQNFDFYIKNIVIEYTVYTTAPSAKSGIASVDRTINATADKKTVDIRPFFQYATPAPDDFRYSYEIVGAPEHAHLLEDGYTFWADAVGDYTVRAKVNAEEDHRESDWSSTKTIHVNKVPYVFNNSEADKEWQTTANWTIGSWPIENLPTEDDDVIVRGHLTIDEEIAVNSVTIEAGEGRIVEIAPEGGLTVGAGGITGATKDNLKLKAGTEGATKGQTGYLRISPDYTGAMPEASVEMYATAFYDVNGETGSKAVYQCVGAPIDTAEILASTVFNKGSYLYTWNESTGGWENSRTSLSLTTPFRGYEITQKKRSAGWTFTYAGDIVSGHNVKEIDLSYTTGKGYNLLANSFTAPIDITSFQSTDFTNASQTIYILNAGTMNESKERKGGNDAPGKWVGVPINTAEYLAEEGLPRVIAPMQGFWIKTNNNAPSKTPQLKLDYSRLVWGVDYSGLKSNTPLRVSKRETEQTEVEKMTISVSSESERDVLFLLESEQFDQVYEDGYDAYKVSSGSLDIYTLEGEDKLSVDATNSIIGTRVGVRTSAETAYTLSFNYVSDEEWALYDAETENTIDINEGMEYTFFAEPNSNITERFMIVERADAPNVTTGVDNTQSDVKASKFIKDGQLFILKNGVLYDATGARVR